MTAYGGKILGPIAKVLGVVMNAIYVFIHDTIGIESGSITISIILFTIVIYICLFPLTYKQQKFSTLSRKMQPELKEIQKKYKNRKDQASMAAQSEETQALYDKYGISPSGSCVTAFIQMPILLALYRVFLNIPAYLPGVKNVFSELVDSIVATKNYDKLIESIYTDQKISRITIDLNGKGGTADKNYIIDVLYKLSEDGWELVADKFPKLVDQIDSVQDTLSKINYIFGINISDTPLNIITTSFKSGSYGLMIGALLIPLLAYGSQLLNLKLVPQAGGNDQMAQQMKTMNTFMPLMSLFFTFYTPAGLGIYWIAGAVIRSVQQVLLNRHFEKLDLEKIIEANKEKAAAKAEKRGIRNSQIMAAANINTRSGSIAKNAILDDEKKELLDKAAKFREDAHPDSLSAKAEKVKLFNENKEGKGGDK